jgi:outer membrane protein OmpA-like peptidoglycan-associated protein
MAVVALFFVVLGWLYIAAGRLPGGAPQLEFKLAAAAHAALDRSGLDEWARVEMDGRAAVLTGVAPDEASRAAAIDALKGAVPGGGIARVIDETDLRMVVSPYVFEARLEGERLTLTGYAPDRAAREAVLARAAQAFAGEVDAEAVEIASGAPPGSDWLGAVDFGLAQLVRLQEGELRLEDEQLTVVGAAASRRVANEIARQLRQAPAPFTGRAAIESPDPILPDEEEVATDEAGVAAEPAASPPGDGALGREACQSDLDRALAAESFRFRFNDAEIAPASFALVDAIAVIARRCGRLQLVIGGHTDATGNAAFNVYLSEQRARTVRDLLIDRGVDPAHLIAAGFGAAEPIASNASAAGRAQNRRIEIKVYEPTERAP